MFTLINGIPVPCESCELTSAAITKAAQAFMTPEQNRTSFEKMMVKAHTKQEQQAINAVFTSDFVAAATAIFDCSIFLVPANILTQQATDAEGSVSKIKIMRQTISASVGKIRLLENDARKQTQTLLAMYLGDEAVRLIRFADETALHIHEFEMSILQMEPIIKIMAMENYGQPSIQGMSDVCNQSLDDIVAAAIRAGPLGKISLSEMTCLGHQLLLRACDNPQCVATVEEAKKEEEI